MPWSFGGRPRGGRPGLRTACPQDQRTGGKLLSTPHQVKPADEERYAFACFHEPGFPAAAPPLDDADDA